MKLKFMKNRKIHNGKVYMQGTLPIMDLPYMSNKAGTSVKYVDHRPLYTIDLEGYPKFYDGDGIMTVIRKNGSGLPEELIVRSTLDVIEEISTYPNDKPFIWVASVTNPETHYYGLSKNHFEKIKYVPVYAEEG